MSEDDEPPRGRLLPLEAKRGPRLVQLGDGVERWWALDRPLRIGRRRDNDVQVKDRTVSSFHCRIETHGASYLLVDQGSANGTLVNGRRIREVRLRDGDVLAIGDATFRVSIPAQRDHVIELDPGEVAWVFGRNDPGAVKIARWLAAPVQALEAREEAETVDWPVQGERWERCREQVRLLARFHDPEALAKRLARAAGLVTPVDVAVVFLVGAGDALVRRAEAERSPTDAEVPVERALVDRAFHTTRVASEESAGRFALAVPLVHQARSHGVLYVRAPTRLGREDCLLLFALVTATEQGLELR